MTTLTNVQIIAYRGGARHITIFFKDKENKYYVLYAHTHDLDLKVEEDYRDFIEDMKIKFRVVQNKNAYINIPIITNGKMVFNLINIENRKQFELIDEVVSSLLED